MSHLGDSLRTYWCRPSGHDFSVVRWRTDGTMSMVLCLACQKHRASSTCLFCDAEDGTRVTVVSPEGGRVVSMVCARCLTDARRGYQGWRTYVAERLRLKATPFRHRTRTLLERDCLVKEPPVTG